MKEENMKTAKLKNIQTGEIIEVVATTEHSASNYNIPVWVDKKNQVYGQVGMDIPGYQIINV